MKSFSKKYYLILSLVIISGCSELSISKQKGTPILRETYILEQSDDTSQSSKKELIHSQTEEIQDSDVEIKKIEQSSNSVEEDEIEQDITFWRIIESEINVRKMPDIDSNSIDILIRDQDLKYLHKKYFDSSDNRTWYNVQTSEGIIGWVSSKVVAPSDGRFYYNNSDISNIDNTKRTWIVKTQSHIREEPSINSESITVLNKNVKVEYLYDTVYDPSDSRTWYYVESEDGTIGWMSSRVLR